MDTALAYVGGGLLGGDSVDETGVERRDLSRSYTLTPRMFDRLRWPEIGSKKFDGLETEPAAIESCRALFFTAV